MPLPQKVAADFVKRRHPEWCEFQKEWRWLGDSLEGGNRYRYADYSVDPTTGEGGRSPFLGSMSGAGYGGGTGTAGETEAALDFIPLIQRNLIPHRSEIGRDARATFDIRLMRTPVPNLFGQVVRRHLSRIYAREVRRDGPSQVQDWWTDVDGLGSTIDKWMRKVVGPLILTYGHLDLCFDHPQADTDDPIQTKADQSAAGLDVCVASVILPENMLWWKSDRRGHYEECMVLERDCEGKICFRHWTAEDSTLYAKDGTTISTMPHSYGRVPIVRVFDDRKIRCRNTGQPRYEEVAELQKAIYNARSEEILGDLYQAHPLLMIPEKMVADDGLLLVGPEGALKMPSDNDGQPLPARYLEPPKGTDEARQKHIGNYENQILSIACLSRPAGTTSGSDSGGGPIAQSGISKMMDSQAGNDLLSEVAQTLGEAEIIAGNFALLVLSDGSIQPEDVDDIEVIYPQEFDLTTAEDMAAAIGELQDIASGARDLPITQGHMIERWIALVLPGISDADARAIYTEITDFLQSRNEQAIQDREAASASLALASQPADAGDPNDAETEVLDAAGGKWASKRTA